MCQVVIGYPSPMTCTLPQKWANCSFAPFPPPLSSSNNILRTLTLQTKNKQPIMQSVFFKLGIFDEVADFAPSKKIRQRFNQPSRRDRTGRWSYGQQRGEQVRLSVELQTPTYVFSTGTLPRTTTLPLELVSTLLVVSLAPLECCNCSLRGQMQ
jgi:hypothetical protein